MLQDHGSGEPRDVNQTIDLQAVPPSQGQRKKHVLAVASSDETRVERYGSGHVEQPVSYRVIPEKEREKERTAKRKHGDDGSGHGKWSVNETA